MNSDPVLEAVGLEVGFGTAVVVRDFSMRVGAGEKVLLKGPSGCGKSTVLRCFCGLVKPDSGQIKIEGQMLSEESVWKLRRNVAYVAQEPDLGSGTVRGIIERPFHYHANEQLKGNLERVEEYFERFGLPRDLPAKDIKSLSGGEKQRVALVSAILLDRRIFLLDEVTSALDPSRKELVAGYFRQRQDVTVVLAAHDAGVFDFVDRTVDMAAN